MHPARDFAHKDKAAQAHAIIGGRVKWFIDSQGNSVLRIIGQGVEARYYHFHYDELSSDIIAAIETGADIQPGTIIGPPGDVGISLSSVGRADHVHLAVIYYAGHERALETILGENWMKNKLTAWKEKHGPEFAAQAEAWGIKRMNERVIERKDPISGNRAYFIDPLSVLK
jgi:hypothetical protein